MDARFCVVSPILCKDDDDDREFLLPLPTLLLERGLLKPFLGPLRRSIQPQNLSNDGSLSLCVCVCVCRIVVVVVVVADLPTFAYGFFSSQ